MGGEGKGGGAGMGREKKESRGRLVKRLIECVV